MVPSDGHEGGTPNLLVVLGSGYDQAPAPGLARETAVVGVGCRRVRGGGDRTESVAGGAAATARDVLATAVEVRRCERGPPPPGSGSESSAAWSSSPLARRNPVLVSLLTDLKEQTAERKKAEAEGFRWGFNRDGDDYEDSDGEVELDEDDDEGGAEPDEETIKRLAGEIRRRRRSRGLNCVCVVYPGVCVSVCWCVASARLCFQNP